MVVDPAAGSVEAARLLFPTLAAAIGDGEHLPIADACVDVVILNGVVSLFGDLDRALTEVRRVLVPAGRVIVTDIWSTTAASFVSGPNSFRSLEDFTQLVEPFGFRRVASTLEGERHIPWEVDEMGMMIVCRVVSVCGLSLAG